MVNTLTDKEIEDLKQIFREMNTAFNEWDEHIKYKMHPVPIQDLDFWSKKIKDIIDRLETYRTY